MPESLTEVAARRAETRSAALRRRWVGIAVIFDPGFESPIDARRPDENGDNPEQGGSDTVEDPDADNHDNGQVEGN